MQANMLAECAKRVARVYRRRCPWAEQPELEQVAWQAMLEALPRHDAARPLENFLFMAARRAVHRHAWRQGAALHVTTRNAGELPADVRRVQRAAVDPEQGHARAATGNPETALAAAQLRHAVAQRAAELLAGGEEEQLAREVLLHGRSAAEVAGERGEDVRRVQARVQVVKERLAGDARLSVLAELMLGG